MSAIVDPLVPLVVETPFATPIAITFGVVHDIIVTLGDMDPSGEVYHTLLSSLLFYMGTNRSSTSSSGPTYAYGSSGKPR